MYVNKGGICIFRRVVWMEIISETAQIQGWTEVFIFIFQNSISKNIGVHVDNASVCGRESGIDCLNFLNSNYSSHLQAKV